MLIQTKQFDALVDYVDLGSDRGDGNVGRRVELLVRLTAADFSSRHS